MPNGHQKISVSVSLKWQNDKNESCPSMWSGRKTLLWIKQRNHTQKSIGEWLVVVDPKETEDQARVLSYETGLIIVSDFITKTNTTVGISKKYMAALYPTKTGNMVMQVNKICNQQPVMTLPSVNMTNEYIPVTFLLSRFLGHNKLVNLV